MKITVTPIGNIRFSKDAQKWIHRSKANKLFWKYCFDRYAVQDWGDISEGLSNYNQTVMRRYTCLDTEAKYIHPSGQGYFLIRGKYDDDLREIQTVVHWMESEEVASVKDGKKFQPKIIHLKILH